MIVSQSKMKKIIGLRNIITDGKEWKYLLFYDIDNPTEHDVKVLIEEMEKFKMSYLIYSTKAGLHMIGLTPMTSDMWGFRFEILKIKLPEYYSGQTIRMSRKEGEEQKLIFYNFEYRIIPNLLEIYSKRLFQNRTKAFFEDFQKNLISDNQWHLVFEKYWSGKH